MHIILKAQIQFWQKVQEWILQKWLGKCKKKCVQRCLLGLLTKKKKLDTRYITMAGLLKPIVDQNDAIKNGSAVCKGCLVPTHSYKCTEEWSQHRCCPCMLFPLFPFAAIMLVFEPRVEAYLRDKYWAFAIPLSKQLYSIFNYKINSISHSIGESNYTNFDQIILPTVKDWLSQRKNKKTD